MKFASLVRFQGIQTNTSGQHPRAMQFLSDFVKLSDFY